MAPEKNINRKRGKLPAIKTCVTDFEKAAIITLNATIEMLVRTAIKSTSKRDPSYLNPKPSATASVKTTPMTPKNI